MHVMNFRLSEYLIACSLMVGRQANYIRERTFCRVKMRERTLGQANNYFHGLECFVLGTMEALSRRGARFGHSMQQTSLTGNQFFSMASFSEYCDVAKPETYSIALAETVRLDMPSICPEHYRGRLHSQAWPLAVPAVRAIEIPDAEVMGKCDFIFTRAQCLHHGLYQFKRDLPAEEMHGMISINAKKNLVARYAQKSDVVEALPEAISLVGSASGNYVHWLTETAPKLALIDEIAGLSGVPLIVDDGLHPNILESLRCLNMHKRRLVHLKRGQLCKVAKLVAITPVAYVPFDFRQGVKLEQADIDPGWAMFVPRGLHSLRQKLLLPQVDDAGIAGQRLYLRRTSQFRQMYNAVEVEALLNEFGFRMIEPETLSFADQVKLFSSAEIIVAQAGAALGNMIFAPEGCHVVILTAWSPFSIYYYFSNMASILGQHCTFVLCDPSTQGDAHPAHRGLVVDIHTLREVIS
jgi:capsular polysaccharide biosynthesis protein